VKEPGGPYPVGTLVGKLQFTFRRGESTLPVAPSVNVTDETMFESPSGDKIRVAALRSGDRFGGDGRGAADRDIRRRRGASLVGQLRKDSRHGATY
jgi:hypothetical protein